MSLSLAFLRSPTTLAWQTCPFISSMSQAGITYGMKESNLPPSSAATSPPSLYTAGRFSPRDDDLGFYLVYDTLANSIAIVPPAGFSIRTRSKIGAGVGLLCRGDKEGDFVLAEILRYRDDRCREILTNKATLLTWASLGSRSGQWIKKEVLLPLPAEEVDSFCPFIADSVFAIGSTSLCWVDLLRGILVYNHHHNTDDYDNNRHGSLLFHFIPLPEGYVRNTGRLGKWLPQEYRSMCCTQSGQTLKFVSMEDYASDNVSINKVTLRTWTLMCPLRPNHWVWKEVEEHFRIGDLFNDPFYKTELRLQPLRPCCPVISDVKPGVIYLTVIDQEFNHELQSKKARQVYVLSLDMHSQRVVSTFKSPPGGYDAFSSQLMTFRCNFGSYLNKGGKLDERGDFHEDCSRGKKVAY